MKRNCNYCGKEYEYNLKDEIYWVRQFCSRECNNNNHLEKKYKSILPARYVNIDSDKTDLVEDGIEQSLFITGSVGVGKTVLMATIAKHLILKKQQEISKMNGMLPLRFDEDGAMWISYPSLIMELQNMYRQDGSPFERAEEVATYSGTLCIDDLGAEKMTDYVRQITYYIINYREQECLHTLITSNFSLQQIDNQVDPRVSSRIAGMCKIIKLTGKDRRINK